MNTTDSFSTSVTAHEDKLAPWIDDQKKPATSSDTQSMNVVLVHGALVDASGWRPLYNILTQKGFNVSLD